MIKAGQTVTPNTTSREGEAGTAKSVDAHGTVEVLFADGETMYFDQYELDVASKLPNVSDRLYNAVRRSHRL